MINPTKMKMLDDDFKNMTNDKDTKADNDKKITYKEVGPDRRETGIEVSITIPKDTKAELPEQPTSIWAGYAKMHWPHEYVEDYGCINRKDFLKIWQDHVAPMQQELEQLKLYTKSLEIYGTEKQRDDLADERTKHFARVDKLEGLLRETKTYVEYDRNQAIKYSHPTTLATSLLERITSALSGTEEKKPNL